MITKFNFSYFISQNDISLSEDILNMGQKDTVKSNYILSNIGDKIDCIYYIVGGKLALNAISSDGKEKSCMFIKENMFYGEAHIYNSFPTIFKVVTVVPTVFVKFKIQLARHLIETSQEFRMVFIHAQSQKIRSMTGEIVSMMIHTPEERVLHYLIDQSKHNKCENKEKTLCLSQQAIAEVLGMHRVTVANALLKLKKEGYISCARNAITLLRLE